MSVLSMVNREKSWLPRPIEKIIDLCVYRSVDYMHVNSNAAGRALIAYRACMKDKVVNVYTGIGIDRDHFKPRNYYNKQVFNIVTLGTLVPTRGHKYLIEAAKILDQELKGIELKYTVVGGGAEMDRLKTMAVDCQIIQRFNFTGYYNGEISKLLDQADIFVYPSILESFPYSILEAMASGLPVIASRIAGIPEQIIDQESGILVSPGDSASIAKAVQSLINDRKRLEKYSEEAYKRVRDKFTTKAMVCGLKQIYFNDRLNGRRIKQ
jgi:glycosyltransferase involved in cell wall biosynthesis